MFLILIDKSDFSLVLRNTIVVIDVNSYNYALQWREKIKYDL